MRAYSQDLRDKVINKYKEGVMTMAAIAKLFGICYESVRDWVKRYKKERGLLIKARSWLWASRKIYG